MAKKKMSSKLLKYIRTVSLNSLIRWKQAGVIIYGLREEREATLIQYDMDKGLPHEDKEKQIKNTNKQFLLLMMDFKSGINGSFLLRRTVNAGWWNEYATPMAPGSL